MKKFLLMYISEDDSEICDPIDRLRIKRQVLSINKMLKFFSFR